MTDLLWFMKASEKSTSGPINSISKKDNKTALIDLLMHLSFTLLSFSIKLTKDWFIEVSISSCFSRLKKFIAEFEAENSIEICISLKNGVYLYI